VGYALATYVGCVAGTDAAAPAACHFFRARYAFARRSSRLRRVVSTKQCLCARVYFIRAHRTFVSSLTDKTNRGRVAATPRCALAPTPVSCSRDLPLSLSVVCFSVARPTSATPPRPSVPRESLSGCLLSRVDARKYIFL
jgi:hypothetical protein